MSVSNLNTTCENGIVYVNYLFENNGAAEKVKRVVGPMGRLGCTLIDQVGGFRQMKYEQLARWSEHVEKGVPFHNDKNVDVKQHLALVSRTPYLTPQQQLQQQLQQQAQQQAEANRKVQAQITQLQSQIERLTTQMVQATQSTNQETGQIQLLEQQIASLTNVISSLRNLLN